MHIIDVLEAHLDVATTLDSLAELGTALFAAHESLKVCHTPPERRLLALLRRLGTAGYLSSAAKDTLEADIRNLASSLTASRAQTQALPSPLTELQTLLVDSSPAAVSQLASTLWFRYHANPSWSTIALDSVLRMAPQLPPASTACPSPAASLLRALHDRLPTGLEPVLARWVGSMSAAQLCATFGGSDGPVRVALLNELIVEGTIGAVAMLKGAVLPLRRALLGLLAPVASGQLVGAASAVAPVDPAATQALHNAHTILSSVIFSAPEPTTAGASAPSTSSPTTLAVQQRLGARRAALGTRAALPAIAASLALLVIQQDVASVLGLPDLAESTGAVFLRLGTIPELQTLVVRDPAGFKDAMLDSETVGGIPRVELFRPKLLAGLLLLLKDGGAGASPLLSSPSAPSSRERAADVALTLQLPRPALSRPRTGTSSCRASPFGVCRRPRSRSKRASSASSSTTPSRAPTRPTPCTRSRCTSSSASARARARAISASKSSDATRALRRTRCALSHSYLDA